MFSVSKDSLCHGSSVLASQLSSAKHAQLVSSACFSLSRGTTLRFFPLLRYPFCKKQIIFSGLSDSAEWYQHAQQLHMGVTDRHRDRQSHKLRLDNLVTCTPEI